MKIYKGKLLPPKSQRSIVLQSERRNYQPKKPTIQSQKKQGSKNRKMILIALIDKIFWVPVFNVFLSFCFSSTKHNIILLLKYTCVEFISIKLPWENQIKNYQKHKIILQFTKVTKLVTRALVAKRKNGKISKSKTTTLTFFIIWKRSNKIKAVKTGVTLNILCQWQSQISVLLLSVLKVLSFWNNFLIIQCLLRHQKNRPPST